MLIRRKPPRALKLHEAIRHEAAHKRPVSRRDFLAQSLVTGGATVVGPTLAGLLATNPAFAQTLDSYIAPLATGCGVGLGAKQDPVHRLRPCRRRQPRRFRSTGRRGRQAVEFPVGGRLRPAGAAAVDGPELERDRKLCGCEPRPPVAFGRRDPARHQDARGAATQAGVNGAAIPAMSQNDTGTNPHNPVYGIAMAGANGQLLRLIGTTPPLSAATRRRPPTKSSPSWTPSVIDSGSAAAGLVNTGLLTTLMAAGRRRLRAGVDAADLEDEARKRINHAAREPGHGRQDGGQLQLRRRGGSRRGVPERRGTQP